MIPQAYITEWRQRVPWQSNEQVEQYLVICRALVEIFSDKWLAGSLAFRGGTALHKLWLSPQPRYSEDIDLVQLRAEPIKETVEKLQAALSFLGEAAVKPRGNGFQVIYRFNSEFPPSVKLRLKVETNTREHFSVLGYEKFPFEVLSSWFTGACELTTYKPEELLATKLRALYQRRKGRDLFDMHTAFTRNGNLDTAALLHCYREYMKLAVARPPTQKEFMMNMKAKMLDDEFLGDITGLLRPEINYNPAEAYEWVRTQLIEQI